MYSYGYFIFVVDVRTHHRRCMCLCLPLRLCVCVSVCVSLHETAVATPIDIQYIQSSVLIVSSGDTNFVVAGYDNNREVKVSYTW